MDLRHLPTLTRPRCVGRRNCLLALLPLLTGCSSQSAKQAHPPPPLPPKATPAEVVPAPAEERIVQSVAYDSASRQLAIAHGKGLTIVSLSDLDYESSYSPRTTSEFQFGPNPGLGQVVFGPGSILATSESALSGAASTFIIRESHVDGMIAPMPDFADLQFSADGRYLVAACPFYWVVKDIDRDLVVSRYPAAKKQDLSVTVSVDLVDDARGRLARVITTTEGRPTVTEWRDPVAGKRITEAGLSFIQPDDHPFLWQGRMLALRGRDIYDVRLKRKLATLPLGSDATIIWGTAKGFIGQRTSDRKQIWVWDLRTNKVASKLTSPSGLFKASAAFVGQFGLVNPGEPFEFFDLRSGQHAFTLTVPNDEKGEWVLRLPDKKDATPPEVTKRVFDVLGTADP